MVLKTVELNKNIKLDFFHLEEKSYSNADIFSNKKYIPTLNNYSKFLATFDDRTTTSRGVSDIALGYNFSVYREIKDTNELVYVANIANGGLSVTDYNVVNETTYRYYIFKEDDSSISAAVISNNVSTCWWDWSLVDLTPSTTEDNVYYANADGVWKFNLNLSTSERNQNLSNTTYNNLTRFPKVSLGRSNYASSSITCLLGNVQKVSNNSLSYIEPASMLDDWNEFCSNGNLKLLRDRKGNSMLVTITSNSSNVDDITREQVNTITFSWVQVEDASNITVVSV